MSVPAGEVDILLNLRPRSSAMMMMMMMMMMSADEISENYGLFPILNMKASDDIA